MYDHQPDIDELIKRLNSKTVEENLEELNRLFSDGLVFSTSFSQEDQVISHFIFSRQLNIEVFTLDTGRLFPETYSTWSRTLEKYSHKIIAYYPDARSLQSFVEEKAPIVSMNQ